MASSSRSQDVRRFKTAGRTEVLDDVPYFVVLSLRDNPVSLLRNRHDGPGTACGGGVDCDCSCVGDVVCAAIVDCHQWKWPSSPRSRCRGVVFSPPLASLRARPSRTAATSQPSLRQAAPGTSKPPSSGPAGPSAPPAPPAAALHPARPARPACRRRPRRRRRRCPVWSAAPGPERSRPDRSCPRWSARPFRLQKPGGSACGYWMAARRCATPGAENAPFFCSPISLCLQHPTRAAQHHAGNGTAQHHAGIGTAVCTRGRCDTRAVNPLCQRAVCLDSVPPQQVAHLQPAGQLAVVRQQPEEKIGEFQRVSRNRDDGQSRTNL